MCVIYFAKDKQTLELKADMPASASANKDGCGAMFLDSKGKVHTLRSEKSEDWSKILADCPAGTEIGFHFRHSTSGGVKVENSHPFTLKASGAALMHNGIVSGWGSADRSDTREVVEDVLSHLPWSDRVEATIERLFSGSRVLVVLPKSAAYPTGAWYKAGSWFDDAAWQKSKGGTSFCQSSHVTGSTKQKGYSSGTSGDYWGHGGSNYGRGSSFANATADELEYGKPDKPNCRCGCQLHTKHSRKQWQDDKDTKHPDWIAYLSRPWCYVDLDFKTWFDTIAPGLFARMRAETGRESGDYKAWLAQSGSNVKHFASFLYRPLALTTWNFKAWWQGFKDDPDGKEATKHGTTESLPLLDRAKTAVTPVTPTEAPPTESAAWEEVKASLERAAKAEQAAKDAKADIGADSTVRGSIPVVSDFDDSNITDSELGEIAALQRGEEILEEETPWRKAGFKNVTRWVQKHPHDAADALVDMYDALVALRKYLDKPQQEAGAKAAPPTEAKRQTVLGDGTCLT